MSKALFFRTSVCAEKALKLVPVTHIVKHQVNHPVFRQLTSDQFDINHCSQVNLDASNIPELQMIFIWSIIACMFTQKQAALLDI